MFVCWTIDWQDNYLWQRDDFATVSSRLSSIARECLDSKVTWLAEVDDLTDITRYPQTRDLIAEIEASGGEMGIHVHHTSVDPAVRQAHFRRAVDAVRESGGHPVAYAAGMGNYINQDTQALVDLGIRAQRSYSGDYLNGTLPGRGWFPADKRDHIADLFPAAALDGLIDPTRNPSACDWRDAGDDAGYTDPHNYRRSLPQGDLFAVPLGISEGNADGLHQLHIQPAIDMPRLIAIMKRYEQRALAEPVFVACYFHPYDLLDGAGLSSALLYRWRDLVAYQRRVGAQFVTLTEACREHQVQQRRES